MRLTLALLVAALVGSQRPEASQTQTPQGPTFRSSVEVTTLDVTVVDNNGAPVADLRPADFAVRIDGKPRRVVRAEWVPLTRTAKSPSLPSPPDGYSSNEGAVPGRLIVFAIDQPNIRVDGAAGFQAALDAFIDRLGPTDRIAAVALGGGVSTPFTNDRASVKDALKLMHGDMRPLADIGYANLSASEAIEIVEGNQTTLQNVVRRECERTTVTNPNCPAQIGADAQTAASWLRLGTDRTLLSLKVLLEGLSKIDAPKTVVLISEGFAVGSQSGDVDALGLLAAAAHTTVYGLRLDDRSFDASMRRPAPLGPSDRQLRFAGLEMLASISKGGVFDSVASGNAAFQRLERETSGYYLVGVESTPGDTDGKAHPIAVEVGRRGAVVRARRELSHAAAKAGTPGPLEVVAAALSSPLVMPGLPLHVATFSRRDRDPSKIEVLIHADIGSTYTTDAAVTVGYLIADAKGAIVVNQVGEGRLSPTGNGPSALPFTVNASLAPGEYILKLAATEAGRVGSVEHRIHAGLIDAGSLKLSELMVGSPADANDLASPAIGYDIDVGGVQGYIEAYGSVANLLMRYEVAPTADAPPMLSAVVPGRLSQDGRTVFSSIVSARELPAGQYVLRATLSSGSSSDAALKKVVRAFRVLPSAAATPATAARPTPASSSNVRAAPAAIVVPTRPFRREDVLQAETLQRFREIVTPAARQDFDAGVTSLSAGDFVKAEQSFKSAQRATSVTGNGTAPLTYLAATYAMLGHDLDATSIWQAALIDGNQYPQIYEWLAEALIRIRNFDQARSILKEAAEKWPNEARFAERLAALPPVPGNGR